MNPILVKDSYKDAHPFFYPSDTTKVYDNWTLRSSRIPGQTRAVAFGLQRYIKTHLIECFSKEFFQVPVEHHRKLYKAFTSGHYRKAIPFGHIERLHELGYLPMDIYAIPEGFSTPFGVPQLVLVNTRDDEYWLPNFLETSLSLNLWKPSLSATRAQRFRRICEKYGREAGEIDLSYIDYQCHDFSMRGMSGLDDVRLSGLGHLTCFSGTDSQPAILDAVDYYSADYSVGKSVFATEHSVVCAGGYESEQETYRRLISDKLYNRSGECVEPEGVISLVSDTWDLWKVLTEIMPALKDNVMARPDGVAVIRPDSGDPVKIVLGDHNFWEKKASDNGYVSLDGTDRHPAHLGVIQLLAQALGKVPNPTGSLPIINKGACIYGDSINEERCDEILRGIVHDHRLSPKNQVFGVGSYTYEYVTRDTIGAAMKATAVVRGGHLVDIFKSPVTGEAGTPKKSHRGIPVVYKTDDSPDTNPSYYVKDGGHPEDLDNCAFQKVYSDGKLLVDVDFDTVRRRVRAGV